MKKIMKFFAALGAVSLVFGFIVSWVEKRKEKLNCQGKVRHHFYGPYEEHFKRSLDFAMASLALIIFSPILGVIALMVRVELGSPVIFSQERPGRNERIFKLHKFRSMSNTTDENGNLLPDDMRLTKFGRMLRSTSLDELPELFNILKGDMSIVGPRPLAVQYLPYYSENERQRHDVLPGLTGLAQVHGRNATTWEERFCYDQQYVNKVTFAGDIKIILLTIKTVLRHSGIGVRGIDSPPDFDEYRRSQQEERLK